jgi:aerobic-type carbon monoxide dehydrogenase small subunit (CoxS/CutS family)
VAETITFTVNGASRTVQSDPERPLLDVLREDLGLTGTKYGCGEAQCGACSVLVEGKRVFSCKAPVGSMKGRQVTTIEGLSSGDTLHPVQQAFLDEGAYQCGYCIAGMIVSTVAFLKEHPKPTEAEIVAGMNRNLCRCCGYPRILAAIKRAAGV